MKNNIELEIIEALQEDVDKGIVRIPSDLMQELGLKTGDIIEISGKQSTQIKVFRSVHQDLGKKIIRVDGTTRSNISASIGDMIKLDDGKIQIAKSITLAPMQEVTFSNDPTEYFHNKLLDKSLTLGQKVMIDVFGSRL